MDGNGCTATASTNSTTEQNGTATFPARKRVRVQQRDQAARLQAFAYESAMALKESCTNAEGKLVLDTKAAVSVHKLITAWDTAADRLRVLRGRGLPASERPVKPRQQAQVEPLPG